MFHFGTIFYDFEVENESVWSILLWCAEANSYKFKKLVVILLDAFDIIDGDNVMPK